MGVLKSARIDQVDHGYVKSCYFRHYPIGDVDIKVQSDSARAQKESLRFIKIQSLWSIDISAAYLQSKDLKRDVFCES